MLFYKHACFIHTWLLYFQIYFMYVHYFSPYSIPWVHICLGYLKIYLCSSSFPHTKHQFDINIYLAVCGVEKGRRDITITMYFLFLLRISKLVSTRCHFVSFNPLHTFRDMALYNTLQNERDNSKHLLLTVSHWLSAASAANWFNKGHAMCYHVHVIMHAKDPRSYLS